MPGSVTTILGRRVSPTPTQQRIVQGALEAAAQLGVGCECRLFPSDADRVEMPAEAALA